VTGAEITTSYLLFIASSAQDGDSPHCRKPELLLLPDELPRRYAVRVLIADDQKSVGTTLAALVTQCRHEVVEVVSSGLEAIQAYTRHQPDVVLMDYWMPRLNGATACRTILARFPKAQIILISGAAIAKEVSDSARSQC
jgi:CheY-like chemotaxis protein